MGDGVYIRGADGRGGLWFFGFDVGVLVLARSFYIVSSFTLH
jgi:hypothetical protein